MARSGVLTKSTTVKAFRKDLMTLLAGRRCKRRAVLAGPRPALPPHTMPRCQQSVALFSQALASAPFATEVLWRRGDVKRSPADARDLAGDRCSLFQQILVPLLPRSPTLDENYPLRYSPQLRFSIRSPGALWWRRAVASRPTGLGQRPLLGVPLRSRP